jgi:hypothetical protein
VSEDPFESAPLTDEEHQAMTEMVVKGSEVGEVEEMIEVPSLPPGRPAPPLEEYVAAHVEACRLAIEDGLKDPDGQRLARAERYARWRWQGYVDGHIGSL